MPATQKIALAVVIQEGRVLLARRPAGHLAGYWEFPGGKVESGESPAAAAVRELEEETGLSGTSCEELMSTAHTYPEGTLELIVFLVRGVRGVVRTPGGIETAWVEVAAIDPASMPPANGPILSRLREQALTVGL